jgi:uncharacterized protein (TIGR03382 family)
MSRMLSIVALAALSAASNASITSTTGGATLIPAPLSCVPGAQTGNTVFCWDEATNVNIAGGVFCDLINPPNSVPGTPLTGFVFGTFDSHFLHIDFPFFALAGTITFNQPIAAIIWRDVQLNNTDASHGAPGTLYPTGGFLRGWPVSSFLGVAGNVLTFNFNSIPGAVNIDQIRVLTHSVPTPGTAALLGLGGAVALRRRR